jgi:hypothetical protein
MPRCCIEGDHRPRECAVPWFGPLEEREAAEDMASLLPGYVAVPHRARELPPPTEGWVLMPSCCLSGVHCARDCQVPWFGPLEEREAAEEAATALGDYLVVPYRARDMPA